MKNFKKFLKNTTISMMALALVPWSSVGAVPTILVDPSDNIPKEGTTQLQIVGAGLEPNRSIQISQVSMAPYSAAEGDTITSGVKVETMNRGVLQTDSSGALNGSINVTYDPRINGPVNINYCDTIQSLLRICMLEFRYVATDTLPGGLFMQYKIYFGMSGPVIMPPPATTPLTKDDCKDEKWNDFAALGFKNQGACVSFVAGK